MRIPGLKTIYHVFRQFRSRLIGGAMILGYHQVCNEVNDPFSMAVSPDNFAEQLQVIREFATPISMQALITGLRDGKLPRHSIAITMDDGYADNLYNALPLLEKYKIPATIFVISGCLGQEFWWDELVRIVFTKGVFADGLCLTVDGRKYAWNWQVDEDLISQQNNLLQVLYRAIRPLPEPEQQKSMEKVRAMVGTSHINERKHRALSEAELTTLAKHPLIEIGSHTHSHPALADLTSLDQRYELEYSRSELAKIIGKAITGFSFPHGSYSSATLEILRNTEYSYACSSDQDTVRSANQCYKLSRLWVPNLGGDAFGRWLNRWLPK